MADRSLGELFDSARADFGAMKDDTIALGKQEIGASAKQAGIGTVAVLVGLVLLLLSPLFFAFAFVYLLISFGLWPWVAFVAVAVAIVLVAAGLAFFARSRFLKVKAPKRTIAAVKGFFAVLAGHLPTARERSQDPASAAVPVVLDDIDPAAQG